MFNFINNFFVLYLKKDVCNCVGNRIRLKSHLSIKVSRLQLIQLNAHKRRHRLTDRQMAINL